MARRARRPLESKDATWKTLPCYEGEACLRTACSFLHPDEEWVPFSDSSHDTHTRWLMVDKRMVAVFTDGALTHFVSPQRSRDAPLIECAWEVCSEASDAESEHSSDSHDSLLNPHATPYEPHSGGTTSAGSSRSHSRTGFPDTD